MQEKGKTATGRNKAISRNKHYLDEEKQWLLELFNADVDHQLSWSKVTEAFNAEWQGKVVKAGSEPRPERTMQGLQDMARNDKMVNKARMKWSEKWENGKKKENEGKNGGEQQ